MLILRVASAWVENQEAKYALTSSLPSMKAGPREFLFPSEHGYFGMKFGAAVSLEKIGQLVNLLKNFSAYSEATDVLANHEVWCSCFVGENWTTGELAEKLFRIQRSNRCFGEPKVKKDMNSKVTDTSD